MQRMGDAAYPDKWAGTRILTTCLSSNSRVHPEGVAIHGETRKGIHAADFAASCGDRGLIAAPLDPR